MTVKDIVEKLQIKIAAGEAGLSKEVKGVYTCDLLSWVMAHAEKSDAWITIQTHPNVIAVASLLELSCVIVPENAEIDDETIIKANEEAIPLLTCPYSSYKICTLLYEALRS